MRAAVVVGNAVSKSAARRNTWKREAREVLISLKKRPHDRIVIVSPSADKLTRREFRAELRKAATSYDF